MRLLLILVGVFLFYAQPVRAAGPTIGPLCIDGVASTPHPDRASQRDNGTWTPVDYVFDRHQVNKALLVVFDRSITPTDQFETCAATQKRMIAEGAHTILSGRVLAVTKLSALVYDGPGGNRFQIDPGSMDITLGRVESGARPVIGGTIDFRGSQLWIGTTQTVLATATAIRGEFDVEAYNRTITGAHVSLGGLDYVLDLRPSRASNVSVRLDLGTGQASLWAGRLTGQPKAAASADAAFPYMTIDGATIKVGRIDVAASSGSFDATFSALSGNGRALSITNSPLIWRLTSPNLTIGKAQGVALQSTSRLAVADPDLTAFSAPGAAASLESAAGESLFRGKADANFADLGSGRRSGTSQWTSASSPVLTYLMPSGITKIKWTEAGYTGSLVVSGSLDVPALSFGGMQVTQPLSMALQPARLTGDVIIPIKVDVPAAKGAISFLNGDQTVGIEGRLDKLAIDGKLVISVPALATSHFEAQAGKINVAIGAAVSVSPVIAGAKPNFLNAEVSGTNLTDYRVAKSGSQGIALLSSDIFILAQPVFKIGDNGTASQASVDLRANGSVKLQYDLAAQKMGLAQAKLTADNVTFSLIGPGEKTVDLGGTLVTNPTLSLKKLVVEVDRLSPIQIERADLDSLSVAAAKVAKTRPPGTDTGLAYSGTPTKPLTVSSAHATRVKIDDTIAIGLFSIQGLDFGVNDASVDFGSGITLAEGTLDLGAAGLTEADVLGKTSRTLQAAHVTAGGKIGVHTSGFSINDRVSAQIGLSLDGPEEALTGAGTIDIGAFTGDARSSLKIAFDCRDTHELDVDMETNFGIGGMHLNARMHGGKLSGDAGVGPIVANIHNTGARSCNSPVTTHVIAPKGKWWTDGICNRGLKFYHCRWESPEISYSYHITLDVVSLSATAALSNPHVYLQEDGNLKVCNVGAVAVTLALPPPVGGFSPGIDSPYPGLDTIVNGIIRLNFVTFQSTLASTVGNPSGWLVSAAGSTAGNAFCIGRSL